MHHAQDHALDWRRITAVSLTLSAHALLVGVLMLPPAPAQLVSRVAQVDPPVIFADAPPPPPPPPPAVEIPPAAPMIATPSATPPPAPVPEAPVAIADQGEIPAPPPQPPAPPAPPQIAVSIPAEPLSYGRLRAPPYPIQALRQGIQGTVIVRVLVGVDGRVLDAEIQKQVHPLLDRAALQAVRRWAFSPASRDGVPYPEWATVPVRFQLD